MTAAPDIATLRRTRTGVTVAEASAATTLSQWSVREAVRSGRIRSTRVGRRIVIPVSELDRLVEPDA